MDLDEFMENYRDTGINFRYKGKFDKSNLTLIRSLGFFFYGFKYAIVEINDSACHINSFE